MRRFPEWLRRKLPEQSAEFTHATLAGFQLNTVCESALCPNRSECYARRTATFMILGDICTRRCGFCAISVGKPHPVEENEPLRVAQAAKQLGLAHVVVTSVARDDLEDEGADAFYQTVRSIQKELPAAVIEVLTPDFHAKPELIAHVCDANPTVYNHNVETVERLNSLVRPQAKYKRSLEVLNFVKSYSPNIVTKSGLMMGLGETLDEVIQTLEDLRSVHCEIVTIGQYLKPAEGKLEVQEFVPLDRFEYLKLVGKNLGFREVYSGPYVRSSYHAGEVYGRAQQVAAETV